MIISPNMNGFVFTARQHYMQSAVLAMIDSVCLSACHSWYHCQNVSNYDHGVFTGGYPHDPSFLTVDLRLRFFSLTLLIGPYMTRHQLHH